jgi:hypothetical protein
MKLLSIATVLAILAAGIQDSPKTTMKKPEVGKPAPAVRLNDHHGNIVELGGKRANWTVLAFFPKAATPG